MALGGAYASVSDLEAHLGKSDDGTFGSLLDAASRAVESFTRRQFNKASEATARRFRAVDCERLPVDDFWELDSLVVEVNGSAWDSEDIDARPWNGIKDGQLGWPYYDLFSVSRRWPYGRRPSATVTAKWGWPEVPAGITIATLDVASAFSAGGSAGPIRSESIDGYSVSYASTVMLAMAGSGDELGPFARAVPYRRVRFGVA